MAKVIYLAKGELPPSGGKPLIIDVVSDGAEHPLLDTGEQMVIKVKRSSAEREIAAWLETVEGTATELIYVRGIEPPAS